MTVAERYTVLSYLLICIIVYIYLHIVTKHLTIAVDMCAYSLLYSIDIWSGILTIQGHLEMVVPVNAPGPPPTIGCMMSSSAGFCSASRPWLAARPPTTPWVVVISGGLAATADPFPRTAPPVLPNDFSRGLRRIERSSDECRPSATGLQRLTAQEMSREIPTARDQKRNTVKLG